MPGNEDSVNNFFVMSLEENQKIELPFIGELQEVSMPIKNGKQPIKDRTDLINFSSNDRHKKADVYLNNYGISVKEEVAPLYNKIQRKHIELLINHLFDDDNELYKKTISSLDYEINKVNQGDKRDIPWRKIFLEKHFFSILKFLMMDGYADLKLSPHKADFILIAPKKLSEENIEEIKVLTFDEYFGTFKDKIVIAARKIWIGSNSRTENARALSISKNDKNKKWVYKNISGNPREWDPSFQEEKRREVFYLNINST